MIYLFLLLALLSFDPLAHALDRKMLSDVFSLNETLQPEDIPCPDTTPPGGSDGCPGLPAIKDSFSPKPEDVLTVEEHTVKDALLHAFCPKQNDLSSCRPFPKELDLANTTGGFVTSGARYSASNLKSALAADQRISRFVASSKGKFRGLCDPSFHKPYAVEQVRECMKMPGMIGVGELNLNGDGSFSSTHTTAPAKIFLGQKKQGRQRFEAIAEAVQVAGGGTISVHLADAHDPSSSEVDSLLEIARKYPKVTFIICHSGLFHGDGSKGFGLEGLKKIGKHFRDNPELPKNIWTDLSAVAGNLVLEDAFPDRCSFLARQAELADAWREFGINRVLFASDGAVGPGGLVSADWTDKSITGIISNPFLTAAEKQMIFSGNFENLVSLY